MSQGRISFELTTRCNLKCAHCLRDKSISAELKPGLVKKVLKEVKAYGIDRVSFTGGEPLLHPDFKELIEFSAKEGFKISFVTNGILLPQYAGLLAQPEIKCQLERVCISIEGPDAETNDQIRGKGSFEKILKGILSVRALEIPFMIKLTIMVHNYKKIEEMALFAGKLGAKELQLSQIHLTPGNLSAGLVLEPEKWEGIQDEVSRLADLVKVNVVFCAGIWLKEAFPVCTHLGMTDYYVNPFGWLCVCCVLPGIAGRDARKKEKDLIADLSKTSFIEAHRRLMARINWLNEKRLKRIEEGRVDGLFRYQCLACAFYFEKLDWLKEFPDSAWAKMLKEAKKKRGDSR